MAKRTRTTANAGPKVPPPRDTFLNGGSPASTAASPVNFPDCSSALKKNKVEEQSEAQPGIETSLLPSTTLVATSSPKTITIVLQNADLKLDRSRHQKHGTPLKLASADSRTNTHKRPASSSSTSAPPNRPDITHQCLMMLLDSPLNKTTKLNILMENIDGKVIRVSSTFRVPRTWRVFAKVMADFLTNPKGELCEKVAPVPPTQTSSAVDPSSVNEPFLKVLEPPLTSHLPDPGSSTRISIRPAGIFCRLRDQLPQLLHRCKTAQNLVFLIDIGTSNAPAQANATSAPVSELTWTLSHYPIASSVVCNRLCNEVEYLLARLS